MILSEMVSAPVGQHGGRKSFGRGEGTDKLGGRRNYHLHPKDECTKKSKGVGSK